LLLKLKFILGQQSRPARKGTGGWGEQGCLWRWRLLSSAHKFTKISQPPTDQQNKNRRHGQGSLKGRWVWEGEGGGVSCCSPSPENPLTHHTHFPFAAHTRLWFGNINC